MNKFNMRQVRQVNGRKWVTYPVDKHHYHACLLREHVPAKKSTKEGAGVI